MERITQWLPVSVGALNRTVLAKTKTTHHTYWGLEITGTYTIRDSLPTELGIVPVREFAESRNSLSMSEGKPARET